MPGDPPRQPLFDRNAALERLGGDEDLFRELAGYFREDSQELLNSIIAGSRDGDWPAVRLAAHSLKGLAANFSAAPATEATRQLEEAAAAEQRERVQPLVAPAVQEIKRLAGALPQ